MVYLYICIQSLFIAIVYFSIWIQFLFISIVYFSLLFYIRSFVFNICSFLLYIFRCYSIFDHLYLIINDLYAIVFHLYSMTCIYIPKFSFVFYITVYLDFAKAFDSVAHERLLRKISAYGIKGSVLSWIRDFLTGRRQYVSVKGESSTWKDVVSGVPQGSVLGPVLVIIFINDLPEVVNSIVKIFADDTKLYNKDSNNDIIHLGKIMAIEIQCEECKTVHYGRNNQQYQYTMNFEDIESDSEEKDLGVIFQEDLKFSSHIAEKSRKQTVYCHW